LCGHAFAEEEKRDAKREAKQVEAELVQITEDMKAKIEEERYKKMKYNSYKKLRTFEKLEKFGKAKGYKPIWCVFKAIELGIKVPDELKGQEEYAIRKMSEANG
jgi:hypothetical protein